MLTAIQAAPPTWLPDRDHRKGGETLSSADYQRFYSDLPYQVRRQIEERWGKPEQDPFYIEGPTEDDPDCGRFALSTLRFGNVLIGIQPARGYNIYPNPTYPAPQLAPPPNSAGSRSNASK